MTKCPPGEVARVPLYDKEILTPVLDAKQRPLFFHWRCQVLHVAEAVDRFVVTGEWWAECVYWRLRVKSSGGLYELYHEQIKDGR